MIIVIVIVIVIVIIIICITSFSHGMVALSPKPGARYKKIDY